MDLKELEARALAILRRDFPPDTDIRTTNIQQLEDAPAGNQVYVFSASQAGVMNDASAAVALNERGTEMSMDFILGKRLVPVYPGGTVIDVPPTSVKPKKVTINPSVNDLVLEACQNFTETISVFIPAGAAASRADVYFLADTTGSMNDILKAVQAGAVNILTALNGLGLDIVYGVGNYKDFPIGPGNPYCFQHQLNPTNNTAAVQAAINTWTPFGGNDTAEGQLFALDRLAENPLGTIGWRANSKRIIVWFGDAPGHDPICPAISGDPLPITEATVIGKLQAQDITVMAISTATGPGMDAAPAPLSSDYNPFCGAPGGAAGQATRIANSNGGQHIVGINSATIVSTIITLVQTAINTINSVTLVPTGCVAGYVTSITPPSYGPLNGQRDHTLTFTVTFTGGPCTDKEQVCIGTIDVVIDGVVLAQKPTRIKQPPCGYVYSVKFVCGKYDPCCRTCGPVQPGIYSTEINIQNPNCADVVIRRSITAVVRNGAVVGRDPSVVTPLVNLPALSLPAFGATMEDCCWIQSHIPATGTTTPTTPTDADCPDAPLNIGFVTIRSSRPLAVVAVHTVSDMNGKVVDMEVVQYDSITGA